MLTFLILNLDYVIEDHIKELYMINYKKYI